MIDSNKRQEQASIGLTDAVPFFFLYWFFNGINAYCTYSCTFLLPTGYSSLPFLVEACISQEVFPEHDST